MDRDNNDRSLQVPLTRRISRLCTPSNLAIALPAIALILIAAAILGGRFLGGPWLPEPRQLNLMHASAGSGIESLTVSPDGKLVVLTPSLEPLRLWTLVEGSSPRTIGPDARPAWHGDGAVAFSGDMRLLASAQAGRKVVLWNLPAGDKKLVLRGHRKEVSTVAFSRDGKRLASGSEDRRVRLWEIAGGKMLRVFRAMPYAVYKVDLSPDGTILRASDVAGNVDQWDTRSGKLISTLAAHPANRMFPGATYSAAFSSDGSKMARQEGDRAIGMYDLPGFRLRKTLAGHAEYTFGLAFSPDGRILASAGRSGHNEYLDGGEHDIRLWDADAGRLLARSRAGSYGTQAFTPDGKTLITGQSGGELLVWDLSQVTQDLNAGRRWGQPRRGYC